MSGFSARDAEAFYCKCGLRYLWEHRTSWDTENADRDYGEEIRPWHAPRSRPVTACVGCGAALDELRRTA